MASIYSFLKNVFQDLKEENSRHNSFVPAILVLLTIPLSYAFNSISLGIFVGVTLLTFKKENFSVKKNLIPVFALYFIMILSLVWTLSVSRTSSSLVKELPLFAIPLCFFLFKPFSESQVQKILKFYSFGMVGYAIFYFLRAVVKFLITKDTSVFFYHELVTKDVNAIHVSVYMALACFYFLLKQKRNLIENIAIFILALIIFLLASKNVIVVFLGLLVLYYFFYSQISKKVRYASVIGIAVLLISLSFVRQIRERFLVEIKTNVTENTVATETQHDEEKVYNVSVRQAWTKEHFQANDFFPGTAFRVYQIRIFLEMMKEDPVFFTGYGLNASNFKIAEKAKKYNIHESYANYNFHNQYVQNFAELGFFGFLSLILILFINIKNAFNTKYFVHLAFAILMITLFLTESFLWRQRGVVFFTMFYCLFNTETLINARKKKP